MQLDPGRRGNRLALVDERVDEVAEVGRRSSAAKWKSCGSPVSAATALTVALKISFDHCAGRRSSNASAFRPDETISSATSSREARRRLARRAEPRRGVEDVLDVRVAVARAAHERDGRDQRPVAVGRRTISSAPSPFCTVITARRRSPPGPRAAPVGVGALASRRSRGRRSPSSAGVGRRRTSRRRSPLRPDAQPVLLERPTVLVPPAQDDDVRNPAQMPHEEAGRSRRRRRRRPGGSRSCDGELALRYATYGAGSIGRRCRPRASRRA